MIKQMRKKSVQPRDLSRHIERMKRPKREFCRVQVKQNQIQERSTRTKIFFKYQNKDFFLKTPFFNYKNEK